MSSVERTILDLRIEGVQLSDQDQYLCMYSSEDTVYQQKVNLSVLVPPVILSNRSSPDRVKVQEGATIDLKCSAWGLPMPKITWHLIEPNNSVQQVMSGRYEGVLVEGQKLKIHNVSRTHRGFYKCRATNGLKTTAVKIIELVVQYPPNISMAHVELGQQLYHRTVLRAIIDANPIHSFHWEFNGRPIDGPNSNCIVALPNEKYCVLVEKMNVNNELVNTALFINNLTSMDFGTYKCVVRSIFGTHVNKTEIFRTYPDKVLPQGSVNGRDFYISLSPNSFESRVGVKPSNNGVKKFSPRSNCSCTRSDRYLIQFLTILIALIMILR